MLCDSEQQSRGERKVIGELVGSVKQVKTIQEPGAAKAWFVICYHTHSLAQPAAFL